MANDIVTIITSHDPETRNQSLDGFCRRAGAATILEAARQLDDFRRTSENLYERVRAIFFLAAIYRYHLPAKLPPAARTAGAVRGLHAPSEPPLRGGDRSRFLAVQDRHGPSDAIASALAAAYQALGFQTLADQVRRSVRSVRGNQWMFRMGHPADHPLEIRPALTPRRPAKPPRSRSSSNGRPSAWTSRTAAGATSSSWAWTFPEGPGC